MVVNVLFTDFTELEAQEMAIPHNIFRRTYEFNLQCCGIKLTIFSRKLA